MLGFWIVMLILFTFALCSILWILNLEPVAVTIVIAEILVMMITSIVKIIINM